MALAEKVRNSSGSFKSCFLVIRFFLAIVTPSKEIELPQRAHSPQLAAGSFNIDDRRLNSYSKRIPRRDLSGQGVLE
jgi:hypothetical protein